MLLPYKDLPAAADLFDLAGKMYSRLADAANSQADKARLTKASAECAFRAQEARGEGARTK